MSNYDQGAAQDAGYAAGAAEGDYNQAGQDVRQGEQSIENAPADVGRDAEQGVDNGVRDVENVPSDIGGGMKGAANWIGSKVGSVEGDTSRAEGDVSGFDNSMDQSYNQGEQQGRQ
ncbi:hypothetical protein LTS16_013056 [Friedmanniomyces endolithicus]|uniref:Uncharacterized protein n=1 Tax=Friedmanniomyces endolithicus TaxID=329885 RepID=A0AAN6FQG1_9PEZI|nr:hypothetical protein LTR82_007300 [Friedmanniomyces endolithicus]KAK0919598.1 hypothetical protein LTR57_010595 [Friedmanniomyces endolithicus]KAK1037203.1 hypothetical protein LTS16_013056 [Friedmanniomyces endolithicus]